nr:MAG TPA: hypothetical protein [Caudoviricetes sp.]
MITRTTILILLPQWYVSPVLIGLYFPIPIAFTGIILPVRL